MNLQVIRCRETQAGRFILKMNADTEPIKEGFITKVGSKRTYYTSNDTAVKEGTTADIDLGKFEVREFPYEFTDEAGNEQVANLKWLCSKNV